jgi:hypothetical protein
MADIPETPPITLIRLQKHNRRRSLPKKPPRHEATDRKHQGKGNHEETMDGVDDVFVVEPDSGGEFRLR